MSYNNDYQEREENVGAGILGAFLLALIGGLVYIGLYWINVFPPICGVLIIVLAIIGFRLFGKKPSLKSVFISLAVSFVVLIITIYFTLVIDAYLAYADWYANGETESAISFGQAILYGYQFLSEPSLFLYYLKQFGLAVLFSLAGSTLFIVDGVKLYKQLKEY